jgi:DUF3017 family protein
VEPRTQPPGPADIPPPSTPVWDAGEPASAAAQARIESPIPAIVLAMCGVVLAVGVAVVVGARAGALTIAGTLAVAAAWRSTSNVGPAGFAVRSRGFDVLLYASGAAAIAVLALTAPGID